MGRRAKTRAERLANGNAGKRPLPPDAAPRTGAKGPIEAPEWIQASASVFAEWNRVATDLQLCGALGPTSVQLLAEYCRCFWICERHWEQLQREGWTFTTASGQIKRHPVAGMLHTAASEMRKFAAELGMSPVSRAKVTPIGMQQPELPGIPPRPELPQAQDPHARFFGSMGPTSTQ